LPLKIRAKGSALAAAADFLGNFLVVEVTPVSVRNIGWRTYLIWAVLNLVNAIIVFIFYPETSGIPLEQIDHLFTDQTGPNPEQVEQQLQSAFYRKVQWSIVGKASKEVKRHRLLRKRLAVASSEDAAEVEHERDSQKSHSSTEHISK
jgi:hypothetical protein